MYLAILLIGALLPSADVDVGTCPPDSGSTSTSMPQQASRLNTQTTAIITVVIIAAMLIIVTLVVISVAWTCMRKKKGDKKPSTIE